MTSIVGAFGVPHNPHFPTWIRQGHPDAPEIERMYGELARHFAALAPDTLIYFTSDHYNVFWENLPIFSVAVAEAAHGASDYPELQRDVRLDPELARPLQTELVRRDFDVGMVQALELDHTIVAPLELMAPGADVAVVPFFINGFMRPLPSAERCFRLGRAIADILTAMPGERRVAAVASGSFSLEIGGPRISEDSHTGVPDPAWVDRVLELLRAGDFERLVAESTEAQIWQAGNAGGEVLDWIAMLGMIDPAPPVFVDVQPHFGHAYAVWPVAA